MAKRDLYLYYQRWLALKGLIEQAIGSYTAAPPEFPRRPTILTLLQKLHEFAESQFQFFYFGFEPKEPPTPDNSPVLQSWDEFPPEDVLTGIINQISHDLALIQRAADQRLVAHMFKNKKALDALDNADKLTWLALVPAVKHKIIDPPKMVLTYFEKAAEFYTIPYAEVALIAVPFSCAMDGNYLDYLSIPHEAGHYVYRHLISDAKKALKGLADASTVPARYRGWIATVFEEMCADIYGCLIAGPVMALDFQTLSLANSQAEFADGDDLHPNAALRPLIYCQVLGNPKVRGLVVEKDNWRDIAGKLAIEWSERLRERHVDYFVVKQNRTQGQNQIVEPQRQDITANYIPVPEREGNGEYGALGDVVDGLINTLIDYITASEGVAAPHDLDGWAGDVGPKTMPRDLFSGLEQWFDMTLENAKDNIKAWPSVEYPYPVDLVLLESQAKYDPSKRPQEFWRKWMPVEKRKVYPWPPSDIIFSGEVQDPAKMTPGTWGYILWAEGWTTDGPSNDYRHPLT